MAYMTRDGGLADILKPKTAAQLPSVAPQGAQMLPPNAVQTGPGNRNTVTPIQPMPQQQAVAQPQPQPMTLEEMQQKLVDAQRQAQVNKLNQAYQQSQQQIQQQRQALDPRYQEQARQLSAQDTMARRALENRLIQGGLSTSGERTEGELAQNAMYMGATSRLAQQRLADEAELDRLLTRAQMERDYGIADAQTQSDIQALQYRMSLAQQADERAYQDRLRQQGIAREDEIYQRGLSEQATAEAKAEQDRLFQQELDTIGRYSENFAAEIARRRATPDTADDRLIPYLEAARGQKVQGQQQSQAQAQESARNEYIKAITARANTQLKQGVPLGAEEAAILGLPKGYVDPKTKPKPVATSKSSGGATSTVRDPNKDSWLYQAQ